MVIRKVSFGDKLQVWMLLEQRPCIKASLLPQDMQTMKPDTLNMYSNISF